MADIVFGLATSHSPMLSTAPELWKLHADRDLTYSQKKELLGPDGQYHTFEELAETAPAGIEQEITEAKWHARYEACQHAMAAMSKAYADSRSGYRGHHRRRPGRAVPLGQYAVDRRLLGRSDDERPTRH